MLLNRTIFAVAIFFWTAAPSLFAQDFLKQLEEKILKRQEDSKSKQSPPQESTSASTESSENLPAPQPPSPPPMLLGPAGKDTNDEELPSPKLAPRLEANPSSRTTSKPLSARRSPSIITNPVPAPGGGGYLGMTVESIPGGGFGLVVAEVKPDSPAWKAGFRVGDRLIGVEGNAVSTVDAFAEQLSHYSPGTPVRFLVERLGKSSSVTAVLMDRNLANRIHGNVPGTQSSLWTTEQSGQGYFGINVANMSDAYRRQFGIPTFRGASVTEVIEGSPAEQAGLRPGDCIVAIHGKEARTAEDVLDAIMSSVPGEVITVSYYRGATLRQSSAVLIRADAELPGVANSESGISTDMLTPEYVATLQQELDRVNNELQTTQQRLQQLEARLQQIENRR
ncbi:MAG: PDZ domain-containing protein [Pirellula sp.]|jgi:C-terminal processing protease CtpA/Prc|nr:PDZ domain-containing protein [Pirellula sp.]